MDSIKNIWKLFGYIALGVLMLFALFKIFEPGVYLITEFEPKLSNYILLTTWIFSMLFFISGLISSIIKVIYHMCLYCYYTFFYGSSYSKIHLKVDQDDIIRESYIELKNKKIIPIEISRVMIKKPEPIEEQSVEENKDE